MSSTDSLARLAAVIESRKSANGGDPQASYVAEHFAWSFADGVGTVTFEATGAGGGGGGRAATSTNGGGRGGAGAIVRTSRASAGGLVFAVTVGSGGGAGGKYAWVGASPVHPA